MAILADVTNISFVSQILGKKSRKGIRSAQKSVDLALDRYKEIRKTSQVVRNDLTTLQQHRLTERIVYQRKIKEIRIIAHGRGRKLKCTEYPELATILTYAFGEYDAHEDGGGLEAHPQLTTGTLYRATDSATTMKRAREILLAVVPRSFSISLSTCYNYTQNFRKGSVHAKQHHEGRGVNAEISLHQPPRTGVQHFVINLHWSTANVNAIVDSVHGLTSSLVISNDAKVIVPSEIAPVQRPGHSWSSHCELPDHSWDQSRTNAITPMTFLFLKTVINPYTHMESLNIPASNTCILHLTRTGQAVTLLNLSFYEPETTFRSMNEVLYLLTLPALDIFFRDQSTNAIKKEWVFVVDNGPAEQPSSPLVQMCLVRMLKFLKLHKITQVSFAEYHSKRNFVERVHAEENKVLSKHGPFSSSMLHQSPSPGTKEHKENMEAMADEIRKCLLYGSFGGASLLSYRGVKASDFVFTDEQCVVTFLQMNEDSKITFQPAKYKVVQNNTDILQWLEIQWNIEPLFEGEYLHDYLSIRNELVSHTRTAWTDKYTTSLYNPDDEVHCRRYELQPLPDYLRWVESNELHYLPLEERSMYTGPWDSIPGAYVPSKILDLCSMIFQQPSDEVISQISLLSWTKPQDVRTYYKNIAAQVEKQIGNEIEREKWKDHALYKNNTRHQREDMCRKLKIAVTPVLNKHEIASLICQRQEGMVPPSQPVQSFYSGRLSSVPPTTAGVQRLSIAKLRSILKYHNLPPYGVKDQLVVKVVLLRQGRTAAVSAREEKQLKDLIHMTNCLIHEQRYKKVTSHIYRKRTHTRVSIAHFVPTPVHVKSDSDLKHLFEPLLNQLDLLKQHRTELDCSAPLYQTKTNVEESNRELITEVGAKVKIHWTRDEIGTSGWRPGWYVATVQKYCPDSNIITVVYASEPNETYDEELFHKQKNTIGIITTVMHNVFSF